MKPNTYLQPYQKSYIKSVQTGTDTKGIDAGIAHEITNIEDCIKNAKDAIMHVNDRFVMRSQKHNDTVFQILVKNIDHRDSLKEEYVI